MTAAPHSPRPASPDPHPTAAHPAHLHRAVAEWYAAHARDLPWRAADATGWGVLVSEVMLQQTPVARVEPVWRAWLAAWPTPADLAAAPVADVLRAWGRLGYPRRALRLRDAAAAIVAAHDGEVPLDLDTLRALPGIGEYTAAAVAAFAYGRRAVVLDTNVRRVLTRVLDGEALPAPSLTSAERTRAAAVLPRDPAAAARWSVGIMELGALVCTARAPSCTACPVAGACAWRAAGYPPDPHAHRRRVQAWHGTDRQARGRLLGAVREAGGVVPDAVLGLTWPEAEQRERALATLVADGLLVSRDDGYALP